MITRSNLAEQLRGYKGRGRTGDDDAISGGLRRDMATQMSSKEENNVRLKTTLILLLGIFQNQP
ncbi:hypothetical protein AALP_AA4G176100 [Arabis alpina]|uniref:Uncharacterized protein n=1 Tax=Arabis alpina TaxID=50452 RepID=A0A087H3X0_ARAAL|nr:hypothetical protein AALP_AA4G176100 [Arabis alpina]